MNEQVQQFLADCRKYLDLAESRAAEGQMAGAISSAYSLEQSAVDLARALEAERVRLDRQ